MNCAHMFGLSLANRDKCEESKRYLPAFEHGIQRGMSKNRCTWLASIWIRPKRNVQVPTPGTTFEWPCISGA